MNLFFLSFFYFFLSLFIARSLLPSFSLSPRRCLTIILASFLVFVDAPSPNDWRQYWKRNHRRSMTSDEELKSPAQTQRIHRCSPNPQDSKRRLIRSLWTFAYYLCNWLADSSDWNMWSAERSPPLPACRLQLSGGMSEGKVIRWFV